MMPGEEIAPPYSPPQVGASFDWQPAERPPPPAPRDRVQFSLRQLMIAVTVVGVSLGTVRWVGPSAFLLTLMLVWLWLANDCRAVLQLSLQNAAVQILGGVVLPLAGIIVVLLDENSVSRIEFLSWIFAVIISQSVVIVAIVAYQRFPSWLNATLAGYLAIHAVFAGCVLLAIGMSGSLGETEFEFAMNGLLYGIASMITECCLFASAFRVSDYATRSYWALPFVLFGASSAMLLPVLLVGFILTRVI